MLSRVFFADERFRNGELLEDSLSSIGVIDVVKSNMPFLFIAGDWMRIAVAILHVFSKIVTFFNLGPQLVILTL